MRGMKIHNTNNVQRNEGYVLNVKAIVSYDATSWKSQKNQLIVNACLQRVEICMHFIVLSIRNISGCIMEPRFVGYSTVLLQMF